MREHSLPFVLHFALLWVTSGCVNANKEDSYLAELLARKNVVVWVSAQKIEDWADAGRAFESSVV